MKIKQISMLPSSDEFNSLTEALDVEKLLAIKLYFYISMM